MKNQIFVIAVFMAALTATATKNHVPDKFDNSFSTIRANAAKYSHVLVVNVNGAISDTDWPLVVNYAASRIPINICTNSISVSPVQDILSNITDVKTATKDPKAVVAVFVERLPFGAPLISVPCNFSRIDVAWLETDKPSHSTLRDRQAKMVLKGIAAACGAGATIEPMCSVFYGSRTLEGMDKTNITISPMAYFPMVEILRALGGDEAVSPVSDEE